MKTRFRYIIITLLLSVVCLPSFAQQTEQEEVVTETATAELLTPEQRLELGNVAYSAKEYDKAIEYYISIFDEGLTSATLCYNLANAYYKNDEIGRAILFYNKALRLSPNNEDARYNLEIALARTKDRITPVPEFIVNRWIRQVRDSLSCTTWGIASILSFALALVALLVYILGRQIEWRKAGFFTMTIAVLLFVATLSFGVSSRRALLDSNEAIIMATATSVKSSPDRSATDMFVLHEGTKVSILSEVDAWCEIAIADGKKGWIERVNIAEI